MSIYLGMATAEFLQSQRPRGTASVIGASGLTQAVHDIGYVPTDVDPDHVVLGETEGYNYEAVTKAVRLIEGGVESGIRTILVLSGVARREDIVRFPYRAIWVLESVAEIEL